MAITLNHLLVPAHDKRAAALFFAEMLGLTVEIADSFALVRVNSTLTLDFDDDVEPSESHHFAFLVDDVEFDALSGVSDERAYRTAAESPGTSPMGSSTTGMAVAVSTSVTCPVTCSRC